MTSNHPSVLAALTTLATDQVANFRRRQAAEAAEIEQWRREEEAAERAAAETAAHETLQWLTPDTLARVVTEEMWRGYPRHRGDGPTAVAHLGAGVYLRYATPGDGLGTVPGDLWLLQPCTDCGVRLSNPLWSDLDLATCLTGPNGLPTTCTLCFTARA
ncbi:hypothetical protein [Streptomyces sp. NPDC048644]|uniref:hypothetical protein n=1 Tax=Streptomyces sp. NPDC048644 TaxID=3365582 RepID=UPI00371EF396